MGNPLANIGMDSNRSQFMARQRIESEINVPRLFAAIDADPAIVGAGVVYIDADFNIVILRDSRGLFSTWSANWAGAMYFCASDNDALGQDAADGLEFAQGDDVEVGVNVDHAGADNGRVGVDGGEQARYVDFAFDALARHELGAVGVHADVGQGVAHGVFFLEIDVG